MKFFFFNIFWSVDLNLFVDIFLSFFTKNEPYCVSDFNLQYLIVCKYFWQLFIYKWKYFYFTFFSLCSDSEVLKYVSSEVYSFFGFFQIFTFYCYWLIRNVVRNFRCEFSWVLQISVTIPQSPKSFHFSDYASQMLIRFSISSEIFLLEWVLVVLFIFEA